MNSEWSLDELYKGFDDPKFAADLAKYDEMIAKTNEFAAKISDMQPLDALKTYIAGSEAFNGHVFICHAAFLREHKGHRGGKHQRQAHGKDECNNKGGNDNQKVHFRNSEP